MSDPDATIGTCPNCERALRRTHVLIDYETAAGERGVWADCPECGEVVDPVSLPVPVRSRRNLGAPCCRRLIPDECDSIEQYNSCLSLRWAFSHRTRT
mgnify:CR=1 FL=1